MGSLAWNNVIVAWRIWITKDYVTSSQRKDRKRWLLSTDVGGGGGGRGRIYLLIFIVHVVIEFRMTDVSEHFRVDLSGVTICGVFIVFLGMFFPLCLDLLEDSREIGGRLQQIILHVGRVERMTDRDES